MKSIATFAAAAALLTVGVANAQTAASTKAPATNNVPAECAAKLTQNAATIAKAQAAKTAEERAKIIRAAINEDPNNAVCLVDLALQTNLNIEPAAGPDDTGAGGPDFTDGTTPPAENPNQLNENTGGNPASPVVPQQQNNS